MSLQSLRNTLAVGTLAALALTVGVVVWGLWGNGPEMPSLSIPQPIEPSSSPDGKTAGVLEESRSFEGLMERPLRGPLSPRNNIAVNPSASNQSPNFSIQLLGTMIYPSHSEALFGDNTGAFDIKRVGETLNLSPSGVEIAHIETGLATLRYAGREIKQSVDAMMASPGSLPNDGDDSSMSSNEDSLNMNAMTSSGNQYTLPPAYTASPNRSPNAMAPAMNGSKPSGDMEDLSAWLPENMNVYDATTTKSPTSGNEATAEGKP